MGEIYTILGKEFPVTKGPKPEFGLSYLLNRRVIVTSEDLGNTFHYDLVSCFPNVQVPRIDLTKPVFGIKVLDVLESGIDNHGLPTWEERHSFKGIALAGYPVANVSYTSQSSQLPNQNNIDSLIPQLIIDFEKRLGIKVNRDEIGLHLFWDF